MGRAWDVLFAGVLTFGLALGGCKKKDAAPGSDSLGNPPVGTVDDTAGFYMRYRTNEKYTYNMHKDDTTFDAECRVADADIASGSTNADITCYLEGYEGDFYYQGVNLQYNVPSTTCAYVTFVPYWYIVYEIGAGPTTVQIDTDKNGAVGVDTNNDGTIDGATATCLFDNSTKGGPNCCTGTYNLTTRSWDATKAPPAYGPPVTTTGLTWGGTPSSCISGPATDTQTKDKNGLPRGDIYFVEGSGINKLYKIAGPNGPPPDGKDKRSNIWISNFYLTADHGGLKPPGLRSVAGGGFTVAPADMFTLTCLDRAFEVKARIKLFIREWNTKADFDARKTAPANHSLVGTETSPVSGEPLNDVFDWKDFGAAFPATATGNGE